MSVFTLEQTVRDGDREGVHKVPVEDGKWVVPYVGTSNASEVHWEEDGGGNRDTTFSEQVVADYVFVGHEEIGRAHV